ncbi:MAG: hypothetical protein ACJ754_05660 [Pyrinomonadaceae bacterium]
MKGKALLLLLGLVLSWLVSGCSLRSYSPECWDFTSLPVEQQREIFGKQPVEKQLNLYLCKMSQHPADSSYAEPIADHGPEVIPTIIEKMRKVDDAEKARLLYIMEEMSRRGYLRQRTDVYAQLSQMVSEMNDVTRQSCEEMLKKIAIDSGIKQFTYTSCNHVCSLEGRI